MKLYNFLNEENLSQGEADAILSEEAGKIRHRAREWITAVKKCKKSTLWRGVNATDKFIFKIVRKERKPTDSSIVDHQKYDEYFLENFGWKARSSGLFSNGSLGYIQGYGNYEYLIFPTKFRKFIWSPVIHDLYAHKVRWDRQKHTYTDKDLCRAISSNNEIMIDASGYYGIRTDLLEKSSYNDDYNISDAAQKFIKEKILR